MSGTYSDGSSLIRLALCASLLALSHAMVPTARAVDVVAGHDLWETPPGGAVNDFGSTNPNVPGDVQPIPADFFFPGSNPFTGVVDYVGNPLGTFMGQPSASADAIVERQADAILPVVPSVDTIPIELVELSLVSVSPILVNPGGTLWDVQVLLEPTPSTGTMTIRLEHELGGIYESSIDMCPRYRFFEVNPPFRFQVLDYCAQVDPAGQNVHVLQSKWSHDAIQPLVSPLSGPNFFALRLGGTGPHPVAFPIESPILPPQLPAVGAWGRSLAILLLLTSAGIAIWRRPDAASTG